MATTQLVSVQEYLRSSYEAAAEYVDGVVEERFGGEEKHSAWQATLGGFFFARSREWDVRARLALRLQAGPTRYRVPDVAIIRAEAAEEHAATVPPLIVFEIISPEDRIARLLVRLADFESMGVSAIYAVDSEDGSLFRFSGGKLGAAASILLREREIPWAEIAGTLR